MGKLGEASLRRWHLRSDSRMCRICQRKGIPGRINSMCKVPEVWECLVFPGTFRKLEKLESWRGLGCNVEDEAWSFDHRRVYTVSQGYKQTGHFSSVPFSSTFWSSLRRIGISSYLYVWLNFPVKLSSPRLLFAEQLLCQ